MKNKFLLLASLLSITFIDTTDSRSQWVQPSGAGQYNNSFAVIGSILFAGAIGGVSRSGDEGGTWKVVNSGLGNTFVRCLQSSGADLYAGTFGGGLFHSTNNGTSWKAASGTMLKTSAINAIAVSSNDLFVGENYGGVYLSTDKGSTWGASNTGVNDSAITSLLVSGSNLFASVNPGGVMLSSDNGTSWIWRDTGLTFPSVTALAMVGTDLFAGTNHSSDTGGGVYRSTDNGATWGLVNNGLPTEVIYSFAVSGTNLFAGTDMGLFVTTNSGSSWKSVNEGTDPIIAGGLQPYGANLFAASYGNGVWRRPLTEMIAFDAVEPLSSSTNTLTAYPNPSSQSATISFTSSESGEAEITIHNLLGAEVARLFAGRLAAGQHSFTWDAQGMAPGAYECVARVNGSVDRARVMIVK